MKTLAAALLALSTFAAVAPAHAFGPSDVRSLQDTAFGPSDVRSLQDTAFGPSDVRSFEGGALGPSDVRSLQDTANTGWIVETLGDRK